MAINDPNPPFTLTETEKSSALWVRLEEHLQERLEECRAQNDGDRSEIQTATLRGQIRTYRALLDLGKE